MKNLFVLFFSLISTLSFSQSVLEVKSYPKIAKVFINGEYRSEAPVGIFLDEGEYLLELKKDDYSGNIYYFSKKILIEKDVKKNIFAKLEKVLSQQYYYDRSNKTKSILDYKEYLKYYPNGINSKEIKDKINSKETEINNTIPENMVYIPGGTYHIFHSYDKVTVNSFFINKYEITFDEYDLYCKETGAIPPDDNGWGRGQRPVINVTWIDAMKYCNWLSKKNNLPIAYDIKNKNFLDQNFKKTKNLSKVLGFRLPSEAEWEFAAREQGRKVRFANGKEIAKAEEINFYASDPSYYSEIGESKNKALEVGSYNPNSLGLYDLSGNIAEWCLDFSKKSKYTTLLNPVHLYANNSNHKIVKGGSFKDKSQFIANGYRDSKNLSYSSNYIGFRIVKNVNIKKIDYGKLALEKKQEKNKIKRTIIKDKKIHINKSYSKKRKNLWTPFQLSFDEDQQLFDDKLDVYGLKLSLLSGRNNNIYGFDISALSSQASGNSSGIQLSSIYNYDAHDFLGLQASGFSNFVVENFLGIQLSGFSNIVNGRFTGIQIAGTNNIALKDFKGLQFSTFYNATHKKALGASFSLVHNQSLDLYKGIQASGFSNFSTKGFTGLQFALMSNINVGDVKGIQIACFNEMIPFTDFSFSMKHQNNFSGAQFALISNGNFSNFGSREKLHRYSIKKVNGIQIAGISNKTEELNGVQASLFMNLSKKVNGVQIAFINRAVALSGIQLGLVNTVESKNLHTLPFINMNFNF